MAVKKTNRKNIGTYNLSQNDKSLKNEFIGIILIALAIFLAFAVFTSAAGSVGVLFKNITMGIFGMLGYLLPPALLVIGILSIAKIRTSSVGQAISICVLILSISSFIHLFYTGAISVSDGFLQFVLNSYKVGAENIVGGGVFGSVLSYLSYVFLGSVGSYILFVALIICMIMVITRLSIKEVSKDIADISTNTVNKIKSSIDDMKNKKKLYINDVGYTARYTKKSALSSHDDIFFEEDELDDDMEFFKDTPKDDDLLKTSDRLFEPPYASGAYGRHGKPYAAKKMGTGAAHETAQEEDYEHLEEESKSYSSAKQEYKRPPLTLLDPIADKKHYGGSSNEQKKGAAILESTLNDFGISAKVINISRGPVITRYELLPAPGIKVSRIVNLADDIALNLAAPRVRIEAPIPGKSAVGIEVPNSKTDMVYIKELLMTNEFKYAQSPLFTALGKDLAGKAIYADIAKMPHLLIAGATGSGKSVCINTLITSLLYKATPDQLRFILIDPKRVELTPFNQIPHLFIPVVTDAKKAASALNWAVQEMTERYKMLAAAGAKDIIRYNTVMKGEDVPSLPYVLVVIDELADLMIAAQREVEDAICRIAQLGRACGIHLVIATQRPSVDVITGVIKANIPSRIAFSVSSQVDSRTILDMAGAEKLMGKGDMLYHPLGTAKPLRLQGAFIHDGEVDRLTAFLRQGGEPEYDKQVLKEVESDDKLNGGSGEVDELFKRAVEIGLEYGQVSTSMIQRRLRVGYARAGRLIDEMEQRNLVSAFEGSKPRKMLISREEFNDIFGEDVG
ncbi:MAG: DNA translocase FtsK 4TM domain-containing protein [Eubacteriales bacterium]